jgi:transposase-like protein
METVQWHEKIKRQLEVVQRWRQSGKSIAAWAATHGVDAKLLVGWVTYEKRWQQRLAAAPGASDQSRSADPAASKSALKTTAPAPTPQRPKGFVAVRSIGVQAQGRVASSAEANKANDCALGTIHSSPASVRMECAGLVLHWPLAQTQELATLLKSLSSPGNVSTLGSTPL